MRVGEWTFLSRTHPLYHRPPDVQAWPFTPPEFEMAEPLETEDSGLLVERLEMRMTTWPGAVRVYRRGQRGPTVQEVRLHSRYAREMDLRAVLDVANRWLEAMRQLSHGPYSLRELARMGHPYGWGTTTVASWSRLASPRPIPRMGRHRYLRGLNLRGPMPNRAVINLQSGRLAQSWRLEVRRLARGLVLRFIADPSYAWYLARGTIYMQPHGPWGPVAQRLFPMLLAAWRRAAWEAWRRQRSLAGQFGEQVAECATASVEAGGFA
ncbi:MAG: hypothetical protein J7M26_09315 [Armatimonadetes bacterium]|nr:hypothetical protein [Armatimonadota bacterium]